MAPRGQVEVDGEPWKATASDAELEAEESRLDKAQRLGGNHLSAHCTGA